MSLDVTIIYKKPKRVDYNATHAACGSTYAIYNDGEAFEEIEWSANITHNMTAMARHIPVGVKHRNKVYEGTLYDFVWHPEKQENVSTTLMSKILIQGIIYMVANRKTLLPFTPANGWGSYDNFLRWLTKYKEACEDNPGCKIIAEG